MRYSYSHRTAEPAGSTPGITAADHSDHRSVRATLSTVAAPVHPGLEAFHLHFVWCIRDHHKGAADGELDGAGEILGAWVGGSTALVAKRSCAVDVTHDHVVRDEEQVWERVGDFAGLGGGAGRQPEDEMRGAKHVLVADGL